MKVTCLVLMLLVLGLTAAAPNANAQIAVIAHKDIRFNDLKLDELKKLYLGELTTMGPQKIQLSTQKNLQDRFFAILLDKTPRQFYSHWANMILGGSTAPLPQELSDAAAVIDFVANTKGAIGIISAEQVNDRVKLLTVDGLGPTEEGYKLVLK